MSWGMAVCRTDGSPLIGTFERRGKEFYCMECGRWYEFLQPAAADETPEIRARYEELLKRFKAGERVSVEATP